MPPPRPAGEEAAGSDAAGQPVVGRDDRSPGHHRHPGVLRRRRPSAGRTTDRGRRPPVPDRAGVGKKRRTVNFFSEPVEPCKGERVIAATTDCPRPPHWSVVFIKKPAPQAGFSFSRTASSRTHELLRSSPETASAHPGDCEGIPLERGAIGRVDRRGVREGCEHATDISLGNVERDQYQPCAAHVIGPSR